MHGNEDWQNLEPMGKGILGNVKMATDRLAQWLSRSHGLKFPPYRGCFLPLLIAHTPLCSSLSVLQTCQSLLHLRTFAHAVPFAGNALSTRFFDLFYLLDLRWKGTLLERPSLTLLFKITFPLSRICLIAKLRDLSTLVLFLVTSPRFRTVPGTHRCSDTY